MQLEIMEAMISVPFQLSFKARTVFFFACCLAACRHGESVEGVLPSEGVRKFSKYIPAFPYAWPFFGQDNPHCAVLLLFLGTEIMRLV